MSYPLTLKRVSSEARSHHREVSGHRHFSAFAPPPVFLSQKKKKPKRTSQNAPLSLSVSLTPPFPRLLRPKDRPTSRYGICHCLRTESLSNIVQRHNSSSQCMYSCTMSLFPPAPLLSSPPFPFLSSLFPRTRIRNLRHIRNIRHVDQGSICSRSSSLLSPLSPALSLHLIDTCLLGGKHRGDDFF